VRGLAVEIKPVGQNYQNFEGKAWCDEDHLPHMNQIGNSQGGPTQIIFEFGQQMDGNGQVTDDVNQNILVKPFASIMLNATGTPPNIEFKKDDWELKADPALYKQLVQDVTSQPSSSTTEDNQQQPFGETPAKEDTPQTWAIANLTLGTNGSDVPGILRKYEPAVQVDPTFGMPAMGIGYSFNAWIAKNNWNGGTMSFDGSVWHDRIIVLTGSSAGGNVVGVSRELHIPVQQWPLLSKFISSLKEKYGEPSRVLNPDSSQPEFLWYSPDTSVLQNNAGFYSCTTFANLFFILIRNNVNGFTATAPEGTSLDGGKFLTVTVSTTNENNNAVVTAVDSTLVDYDALKSSYQDFVDKVAAFKKKQQDAQSQVKVPSF
jgi:hypothetical protein